MGWGAMGCDGVGGGGKIKRSWNQRCPPRPSELFVWLPNTFVRSRKRIQTKQKRRRSSLVALGAQHIVVPAEPACNLAFKHLLSRFPLKTPLPGRVSPRFPPNSTLSVTPQKRRTWGTNTCKQMLMVTCYYPNDHTERHRPLHPSRPPASPFCPGRAPQPRGRAGRRRYLRAHARALHAASASHTKPAPAQGQPRRARHGPGCTGPAPVPSRPRYKVALGVGSAGLAFATTAPRCPTPTSQREPIELAWLLSSRLPAPPFLPAQRSYSSPRKRPQGPGVPSPARVSSSPLPVPRMGHWFCVRRAGWAGASPGSGTRPRGCEK